MRAWLYDRAFKPLTVKWYREVLDQLAPGTHLLDVGIGTGGALVANADLVRTNDLHIHGVDIDPDYVKQAQKAVAKSELDDRVTVALESVYDHSGGPYGAVYFGASFMLMPDPAAALRHVAKLVAPGGRIYFTQTFQEKHSPVLEKVKPMLKALTTIDFGKVTYESDFLGVVNAGGLDVVENTTMRRRGDQTFRRVVAQPRA